MSVAVFQFPLSESHFFTIPMPAFVASAISSADIPIAEREHAISFFASSFPSLIPFCIPSFIGSISPLLILTLHLINRYEVSATAVSIQNFGFFMMVGLLGMVAGMLMNVFEPIKHNNVLVYSNESYLLVFGLFFILSLIEIFCAFKTKDNYH